AQSSAVFDALEVVETSAHDAGAWLAVVAGPAAEAADDPSRESERAFGVGVLLTRGFAFEFGRYGFKGGVVGRVEPNGETLIWGAVSGLNELHYRDGGNRRGGDQVDHSTRLADVGLLEVEAGCLECAEVLFDDPAQPIEVGNSTRFAKARDRMRGQKPPMNRLAILGLRRLAHIDQHQGDGFGQIASRPVPWLAQRHFGEAHCKFRHPWLAPRCGRYLLGEPTLFRQAVDKGEQERVRVILGIRLNGAVLAGTHDQMHIGGACCEVLEDVALPVGYAGNAVRCRQHFRQRGGAIDPALRFFLGGRARAPRLGCFPVPISHLGVDQPNHRGGTGVHRKNAMQQKATQGSAPAERPVPAGPRRPPKTSSLVSWITTTSRPATRAAVPSAA